MLRPYADGCLRCPASVDRYREQYRVIKDAAAAAARPTPTAWLVPPTILGDSGEHVGTTYAPPDSTRILGEQLPHPNALLDDIPSPTDARTEAA